MALVTNINEVIANIERFEDELMGATDLREKLSYFRAWYAHRGKQGPWRFAPSKFVGYVRNTAKKYSQSLEELDGRQTERLLSDWFVEVEPDSTLGAELHQALKEFYARFGHVPNKLMRISVEQEFVGLRPANGNTNPDFARITVDHRICGGRPCIRNMRIRVSDILDMIAGGGTRAEILSDFPYLEDEDITAALAYAAQAVDHRVIRAA